MEYDRITNVYKLISYSVLFFPWGIYSIKKGQKYLENINEPMSILDKSFLIRYRKIENDKEYEARVKKYGKQLKVFGKVLIGFLILSWIFEIFIIPIIL